MKNCAIYSSTIDLEQVERIIMDLYKSKLVEVNQNKTEIKVITKKVFSKTVDTFNIMTSKTNTKKFTEMLNGMYNFYKHIPTKNEKVKEKLLIQISALNMVIGITADKEISSEFFNEILNIARNLNGIVFKGGTDLINSDGKLILDLNGNSEIEDLKVTADSSYLHHDLKVTESALKRKEKSEKILSERGIPYIKHLPVIVGNEDVNIRSLEEIAKRAVALCVVALKGECVLTKEDMDNTKEIVNMVTNIFDAKTYFSPQEIQYLDNDNPSESESIQMTWRYEGLWVLLWVLGFVEKLEYPKSVCDVPGSVRIMKSFTDFNDLIMRSKLRSKEEILDEADLIYRYDWACVDARIKGNPAPAELDSGVVVERHKVLNWVINYMEDEWDDVGVDT